MPPRKSSSERAFVPSCTETSFGRGEASEGSTKTKFNGRQGGGVGVSEMGHLQMPDLEATDSQAKGESTSGQGDNSERARSHTMASTSPRCGFAWLHTELEEQLAAWSSKEGEDLDGNNFCFRFMTISSLNVKRIIGRGGRTLHKLESFTGVFVSIVDARDGSKLCFVGRPWACLLAEFIVKMIMFGHYSIMESLARNGF